MWWSTRLRCYEEVSRQIRHSLINTITIKHFSPTLVYVVLEDDKDLKFPNWYSCSLIFDGLFMSSVLICQNGDWVEKYFEFHCDKSVSSEKPSLADNLDYFLVFMPGLVKTGHTNWLCMSFVLVCQNGDWLETLKNALNCSGKLADILADWCWTTDLR